MRQCYRIGAFPFQIITESEIIVPNAFRKFEFNTGNPEYSFEVMEAEKLIEPTDKIITRRSDLIVGKTEIGEKRLLGRRGMDGFYAYYEEQTPRQAKILLNQHRVSELMFDTVFTSLFALERHLMEKNQFVLHCAYIEHKGKAILFSAPSETGKTTQANLWAKYRQSKTINGDRALLSLEEGHLFANGWPICGSSEICENKRMPVKAIVMLSQGKENTIRRLQAREAFMMLYSQITINSWNQKFVNKGVDFIEQVIGKVPIYHLACTISEEAVEILESKLCRSF